MHESKTNVSASARETAIDWWLRRNEGPLSRKEQAAFDAWLASDEANAAAFDKISSMGGFMASRWPGAGTVRKSRKSRRKAVAALAGAIALLVFFDDISLFLRSDYVTGAGETKLVTLEDGSRVQLDAKSAIAVRYKAGQRRLALLEGEAWFEAAPDPSRPFVVEAAGGTVTALGTAFDVVLQKAQAHVTVTQHSVLVASGGQNVIVEEGQQSAYAESEAAQAPEPTDVARATAWRRGKLIFENQPLGEVARTLGRYHHGYVYFVNSALRSRRVTGVFNTDDPIAALDEIELSLGLHAAHLTKYLTVVYE